MSLTRNDMLSTEGRAPRARRSCYVNEPPHGFFVAGSSLKPMNGPYIRRNAPDGQMLYYLHLDTGWTMELAEKDDDDDDDGDDGAYAHRWRAREDESEWLFVDERGQDRFTHKGDTIVPGAGVRWKHVHRGRAAKPRAGWSAAASRGAQLAVAADDDEEELPWQVIAILDIDILEQLAGGYEYHKQRCAEAVAGRGVVAPPALTSLEGAFAAAGEGRWVYRVAAASGVAVYATPAAGAVPCGRRAEGEYVVGLETKGDGAWLRIEPGRRAYSDRYGASQNWVALRAGDGSDGAAPLTRVAAADGARVEVRALEGEAPPADDEAMMGGGAAEEAAPLTRRASIAAEFLDRPFVPRLDGAEPPAAAPPPAAPPPAAAPPPQALSYALRQRWRGPGARALPSSIMPPHCTPRTHPLRPHS